MIKSRLFFFNFLIFIITICYGLYLTTSGLDSSLSILCFKYLIFPFSAFLIGCGFVCCKGFSSKPYLLSDYAAKIILIGMIFIYILHSLTLKLAKLFSYHYAFFDAGLYANKLWRISHSGAFDLLKYSMVDGHFQPILIPYSFLYKIAGDNLLLPFAFETLCLALSSFPLFLISRKFFSQDTSLLISLTFLVNPLLMFNDVLGFHPDHLILPILLWSFYYAYSGLFFRSFCTVLLILFISEPWVPLISSFGIYLAIRYKCYFYGLTLFILGILFFYLILFILLPSFNSVASGTYAFGNQSIYGPILSGDISQTFQILLQPRKFFFLFFLFAPFLFLPFLGWKPLMIGIPDFLKLLLSNEILHTAVEGHYTIGLIAILFVAYLEGLLLFATRYGINSFKLSFIVFCCTVGFSIGHSPMVTSFNFISNWSSGTFNIKNYVTSSKVASVNAVRNIIDIDHNTHVEIVDNSFYPDIVKTSKLYLFPSVEWQNADFILISTNVNPSHGGIKGSSEYLNSYHDAKSKLGTFFNLIFKDENLELWKKLP